MIVWCVVQRLGWTYEINARGLAAVLPYDVRIVERDPKLETGDVVIDFWWNGTLRHPRLIRQVSSHRWSQPQYRSLTPEQLARDHLADARVVIVPSVRLEHLLAPLHPRVIRTPKGVDPELFHDRGDRGGDITIGWAGNVRAQDKGLRMLRAAWPRLRIAANLPYAQMPDFYAGLDVIAIGSMAEGDPRPLIEGMACGCFPVATDVGIVPELVRHGENGLIVERSVAAFRDAFAWCRENADYVRAAGRRNAEQMRATRTWAHVAPAWAAAIEAAKSTRS